MIGPCLVTYTQSMAHSDPDTPERLMLAALALFAEQGYNETIVAQMSTAPD